MVRSCQDKNVEQPGLRASTNELARHLPWFLTGSKLNWSDEHRNSQRTAPELKITIKWRMYACAFITLSQKFEPNLTVNLFVLYVQGSMREFFIFLNAVRIWTVVSLGRIHYFAATSKIRDAHSSYAGVILNDCMAWLHDCGTFPEPLNPGERTFDLCTQVGRPDIPKAYNYLD